MTRFPPPLIYISSSVNLPLIPLYKLRILALLEILLRVLILLTSLLSCYFLFFLFVEYIRNNCFKVKIINVKLYILLNSSIASCTDSKAIVRLWPAMTLTSPWCRLET